MTMYAINKSGLKPRAPTNNSFTVSQNDIVEYDGKTLSFEKTETKLLVLNKPEGVLSSNKREKDIPIVFDFLPESKLKTRWISVGRLDINSDGLMILTNNPDLSHFLERPENKIIRRYLVKVFGKIPDNIERETNKKFIINGIIYDEVKINVLTTKTNNNILEIILKEGKNREIRKILDHFSLKVKKLTRVNFGPFKLNNIQPGKIVELGRDELKKNFNLLNFKDENSLW